MSEAECLHAGPRLFGLGLPASGIPYLRWLLGQPNAEATAPVLARVLAGQSTAGAADTGLAWLAPLDRHTSLADDNVLLLLVDDLVARYPTATFLYLERLLPAWTEAADAILAHRPTPNPASDAEQAGRLLTLGTSSSSQTWALQYSAMRLYRQMLVGIHPTRLLLANLVDTLDRRLVEQEICHFAGVPCATSSNASTRAPELPAHAASMRALEAHHRRTSARQRRTVLSAVPNLP